MKKEKKKERNKRKKEKQDIKKKQKENIQNGNHFATGCFFSLLYLQKKKNIFVFPLKKSQSFLFFI